MARHLDRELDLLQLALAALDLAQPVLGAPQQSGEGASGQAAAASVEGDALSDAQLVTSAAHAATITARPDTVEPSLEGVRTSRPLLGA